MLYHLHTILPDFIISLTSCRKVFIVSPLMRIREHVCWLCKVGTVQVVFQKFDSYGHDAKLHCETPPASFYLHLIRFFSVCGFEQPCLECGSCGHMSMVLKAGVAWSRKGCKEGVRL